MSVLMPRDNKS